jgi:tetratricopeptide (TPR) repeat protein
MSEDLVERAAAIVRERYDGASANPEHAESRVLFAAQKRSQRRRRIALLAVPLVAALLASTAWGTTSAGRWRALLSTVHAWVGARAATPPPRSDAAGSPPPLSPKAAEPPLSAAGVAPPAIPALLPAAADARRPPVAVRMDPAASRPAFSAQAAPSVAEPVPSEADIMALYRAAHRAQFAGSDPAHALELWDRYLSAAPNGSLSPEARYNRAITLIHLGRKAEAAQALEPFARGDYGTYRQAEAHALLNTLVPAP